jgi:predicted phage terminase large subunit-like protein
MNSSAHPFARLARRNVNRFARFCFRDPAGAPIRPARIHEELQDHLSRHPRALIELPRDHGKSVQMCIRLLWELGRRPGLRIKIVCATEAVAAERGRFIRDAIASNPGVRSVFPHLQRGQPWEAERFTVRRPSSALGPSVACLGVGVRATGTRADLLVCDDIVDVTALRSRADRERVKTYFRENLVNLLEPEGRLWYIFTPWHTDDLSAELQRTGHYQHFRRAIGPNLEPIWPEHWPIDRLQDRRREIGAVAFARAYHLVSVPDGEVAIQPAWVQTWSGAHQYESIIAAVDPATGRRHDGDNTAVVVLGRTTEGIVHCLDATARKVTAPDLLRWIESVDRQWQPDAILFESNGAFAALRDLLTAHATFGGKLRPIVQTKDKLSRIRLFGVHVEAGRFKLQGSADGIDEMTTFPLGEHDDLVDAAAFGTSWLVDRKSPRVW